MLLKIFIVGSLGTNTILIVCEETKKAAIVDPAFGALEKVLPFIEQNNIKLEDILLTHSHWDHIGDVKKIKEKTKAKIYVHKLDSENLTHPLSYKIPAFEKIEGVDADTLLSDGDKIKIGNIEIKVIHTPGHTPGSVCYYIEKEKVLLSGDTLFSGGMGNISSPISKPDLMWGSLKKLSKLPSSTKVYPGHGVPTSIGEEKWLGNAKEFFGY